MLRKRENSTCKQTTFNNKSTKSFSRIIRFSFDSFSEMLFEFMYLCIWFTRVNILRINPAHSVAVRKCFQNVCCNVIFCVNRYSLITSSCCIRADLYVRNYNIMNYINKYFNLAKTVVVKIKSWLIMIEKIVSKKHKCKITNYAMQNVYN